MGKLSEGGPSLGSSGAEGGSSRDSTEGAPWGGGLKRETAHGKKKAKGGFGDGRARGPERGVFAVKFGDSVRGETLVRGKENTGLPVRKECSLSGGL